MERELNKANIAASFGKKEAIGVELGTIHNDVRKGKFFRGFSRLSEPKKKIGRSSHKRLTAR